MQEYNIKPIPANYKGRTYRSMLEVKWAIFFDAMKWNYEYEPTGMANWIPDFAIYGKKVILVEVKPIIDIDVDVVNKITNASLSEYEILLLGLRPFFDTEWNMPFIGWLGEKWVEGGRLQYDKSPLVRWNDKYGFCSLSGSYEDRITGAYNGNIGDDIPIFGEVEVLWNESANKAQWFKIK